MGQFIGEKIPSYSQINIAFYLSQLIEFMIHLVGGKKGLKTGMPLKRKMPLMIGDTQQVATPKRQRYGKTISIEDVPQSYVVNSVSALFFKP